MQKASTLTITPRHWSPDNVVSLDTVLKADETLVAPNYHGALKVQLLDEVEHAESDCTESWRATLTLEGATPEELSVIVKICKDPRQMTRLRNEAAFYHNHLQALQGHVVPRFMGLYLMKETKISQIDEEAEYDPIALSCMILEYCGEPLPESWFELQDEEKLEIWRVIHALHRAGVMHYGIDQCCIVSLNGKQDLRIVGFADSVMHEDSLCPSRDMPEPSSSDVRPPANVGCYEMYRTERDHLQIFKSRKDWVVKNRGIPKA